MPTAEGTLTKVMTLGTYDKVLGTEGALPLKGELYGTASEMEGCGYYVTVDGKNDGERRDAHGGATEIYGGFTEAHSLPAGPPHDRTLGHPHERLRPRQLRHHPRLRRGLREDEGALSHLHDQVVDAAHPVHPLPRHRA